MSSISGIFNLDGSASLADPTSVHRETGCVITADARIDYQNEVLSKLGLDNNVLSDAEIILQAYLRWGENCLDHLLGDFAFAIWDPREQKIFCARDHFGMRPFYYHHAPTRQFLFASSPRAILANEQVPHKINAGRVADFLVPQLEWIDYTSTFFKGVSRLPPGHKLTITPSRLDLLEYYEPIPGPELGNLSDEEYGEGFLDVFSQAIASRLRTPAGAAGSMMSGGIDSGSVVAIAKELQSPLPTFSAVRVPGTDCNESRAIHAAASMPGISPDLILADRLPRMHERLVSGNEEPFDGEFMILKSIYLAARDRGVSVVLDGAAGDIVFNEASFVARLIRRGQLSKALAEIRGENQFWGGGLLGSLLLRHARAALAPRWLKSILRSPLDRRRVSGFVSESLISHELATRVGIHDRFARMRQTSRPSNRESFDVERANLVRHNITAGRERYARLASACGVEACDPYLDKPVFEFCSRLPPHLLQHNGWPKYLLRSLMADRLPDEVVWNRAKPHLGWYFNDRVTREAIRRGELELDSLQKALAGYVDPGKLGAAWRSATTGGDAALLHSAFILATWLSENAQRPVVPR